MPVPFIDNPGGALIFVSNSRKIFKCNIFKKIASFFVILFK